MGKALDFFSTGGMPSAQSLFALAQGTEHAVMITDRDGCIEWVNGGFLRATGYGPGDVIGRHRSMLAGADPAPSVEAMYARCLAEGTGFHADTQLYGADNAPRWQALEVQARFDDAGLPNGCVSLGVDIAERVECRRRLAHGSHEIRTLVYGVLGMLDLALRSDLAPGQRRCLGLASASGAALAHLVNEVLDLSKLEAGGLAVADEEFDLHGFLSQTARSFAVAAHAKGLALKLQAAADLPLHVGTDRTRLLQILTNLLGNAIKFTHRGSVVLEAGWTAEAGAPALRLCVRDTGCGIPPDAVKQVFEPFVQLHPAAPASQPGTGLGLSITRGLVEALHGTLTLESSPGAGSAFTVTLPVRWPRAAPMWTGLNGLRVHLDEPDAALASHYAQWLASFGCRCCAAGAAADVVLSLSELDVQPDDGNAVPHSPPRIALTKPLMPAEMHAALSHLCAPAPRPAERPMAAPEGGLRGLRVLLVEDDPVNRIVSEAILRDAGMEVCVSHEGAHAIATFMCAPFDAVVTDLGLPVIDGADVARAIRRIERERGGRCTMLALSASTSPEDRARSLDAGVDDFLVKPVPCEQLHEVLLRHVHAARAGSRPACGVVSDAAA